MDKCIADSSPDRLTGNPNLASGEAESGKGEMVRTKKKKKGGE